MHIPVLEYPRRSVFQAAALTWHPCPEIAKTTVQGCFALKYFTTRRLLQRRGAFPARMRRIIYRQEAGVKISKFLRSSDVWNYFPAGCRIGTEHFLNNAKE
jgi:hypothetical protein